MALLTIGFTGITIILLPLLVISAQQFDPMEICRGKPNNATVMNPLSCDSFLLCSDGLPAGTGQCPSEMLFNAEKEICNFPENVNCGSVPLPTQFQTSTEESTEMITDLSVETTTSSVPNESCPQIDDPVSPLYMSIPDNCTNYIMCYHGTPLIMQCPIGTEWNKNNSICDTPENAKCQVRAQILYVGLTNPVNNFSLIYRQAFKIHLDAQ